MKEQDDLDALLILTEVFLRHEGGVTQVRKEIHRLLVEEAWRAAMRSRHYLTVECLDYPPTKSAWMSLYLHGSDKNFLNATSLTKATFHQLLGRFAGFYATRAVPSRGRPPKLRYLHQVLGMLMCFYVGSMENSTLRKAEDALSQALQGYAPARIAFPSPSQQAKLAKLVEAREPLLKHTFGFIDGKNLPVMQPSSADLQNAMYNGWLHSVFVTGTICFAADGCIIWSKHNCPGSWNDSDTSLGFRMKLLDPGVCPDVRMNVVSDSAFPAPRR